MFKAFVVAILKPQIKSPLITLVTLLGIAFAVGLFYSMDIASTNAVQAISESPTAHVV